MSTANKREVREKAYRGAVRVQRLVAGLGPGDGDTVDVLDALGLATAVPHADEGTDTELR